MNDSIKFIIVLLSVTTIMILGYIDIGYNHMKLYCLDPYEFTYIIMIMLTIGIFIGYNLKLDVTNDKELKKQLKEKGK